MRENTESMQPPRALWVSFPLGRPLGAPGDPAFQHGVIRAALDLLHRSVGPVLEDYPLDAPPIAMEEVAACPVSFAKHVDEGASWLSRLTAEFRELAPWYELSCRRRGGRTLVGIGDQPLAQNLESIGRLLDEGTVPSDIPWLKRAVDDIRAYYTEAMTAQPGDYDIAAIQDQFWQETEFGAAVLVLAEQFQNSGDNRLKLVARMLAPREAVGAATGPEGE